MTAPATIHPSRTTSPPRIYALVDAEILASQLVYALEQIQQSGQLQRWDACTLDDALEAATEARRSLTLLQVMGR